MKKHLTWLFLAVLSLPSVCFSEQKAAFQLEPLFVSKVTESTALGYGNGRKLISDPDGNMYFSAVSKAPNGLPGVCVIRTVSKSTGPQPVFETAWIENSNGLLVSANMHFASSLGAYGAGPFYVVWAGGDQASPTDPKLAHQLRFAQVATDAAMQVTEAGQPFTVTGFDQTYRKPYKLTQYWQEFPSAFVSKDGKLHVVWEARDKKRLTPDNVPIPGIAYAVRDAAGQWSVKGEIDTPPYLDVQSVIGAQFRPYMLSDNADTLHVLCYGVVHNRLQILHGSLVNGQFSGWTQVARSDYDQRHVSAAMDSQGRIHAAWREGNRGNQQAFIAYSMRSADGKWTPVIYVNESSRNGSTPNITVDDKAAYIVWTGWLEGFENSDSQKNNSFPNDNDTVEGRLEFAHKKFDANDFSKPVFLSGGTGSYPRIARVKKTEPSKLAVIWTSGIECLPHSCVQIFFGELATPE